MNSGIYCYKNALNGKMYVGQSRNLKSRLCGHNSDLEKGRDACLLLQRAVTKYGMDNFSVLVLEYCEIKDLNEREIFWIHNLSSLSPTGYNIKHGGLSGKHSEQTKQKISNALLGENNPFYNNPDKTRNNMMLAKLGKRKPKHTSNYFGVSRRIYKNKYHYWRATIQYKGTHIFLGQFKYEEDAARKYDEFVLSNRLQVPINFPQDVV